MLKRLVEKRNQQLEKVNVFKQKTKLNGLPKLKNLADSIKLSYISFSRSLISVYESILLRTKFGNQLKLFKLVKYFKLMKNEERINLANVGHLLKIELRYYMHILPLNKILLCFNDKFSVAHNAVMLIINKNGDLVKLKRIENPRIRAFRVNATNVICCGGLFVEIYNFNLELVHSFELHKRYDLLKLSNYEIALSSYFAQRGSLRIDCYNYKTVEIKKKNIFLKTRELMKLCGHPYEKNWKTDYWIKFLDLNEEFIFLEGCLFNQHWSTIILLNRSDNNSLFKFITNSDIKIDCFSIFNADICLCCNHVENNRSYMGMFKIYETNLSSNDVTAVYDEFEDECCCEQSILKIIYSTSSQKYILKEDLNLKSNILTFIAY